MRAYFSLFYMSSTNTVFYSKFVGLGTFNGTSLQFVLFSEAAWKMLKKKNRIQKQVISCHHIFRMNTNLTYCTAKLKKTCFSLICNSFQSLVLFFLSCRGRAGVTTKPDKSAKPSNLPTKPEPPASKPKQDCCPDTVETAEGKARQKHWEYTHRQKQFSPNSFVFHDLGKTNPKLYPLTIHLLYVAHPALKLIHNKYQIQIFITTVPV